MPSKRKASASSAASRKKSKSRVIETVLATDDSDFVDEPIIEEADVVDTDPGPTEWALPKSRKEIVVQDDYEGECLFTSAPIAEEAARTQWSHRYVEAKKKAQGGVLRNIKSCDEQQEEIIQARQHFSQAKVDGQIYDLNDDAYVKSENDEESYICRIVELFESVNGSLHFTAQWFYRAKDTVIGACGDLIDEKCVFYSEVKDDNPLNCLLQKLKIVHLPPKADSEYKNNVRANCDYYYEMKYLLPYTSFVTLPPDDLMPGNESDSTVSIEDDGALELPDTISHGNKDMVLMDIYSGCGAMSTGLCLGANRGGVRLTTKWAIDINKYACKSLRLNHPETQVRNESAEDFLSLLKEWQRLCASYSLIGDNSAPQGVAVRKDDESSSSEVTDEEEDDVDGDVYEVEEIQELCYGDPKETKTKGLYFKIQWKGYGPEYDTWEPLECLSGCPEKLEEFVTKGFKSKLLPLPGDVDVICGGPPCQGISGFNRFRNAENPLADEKNKQLQVFMDIVSFLKPRFVLMENVVDIVKFAAGFLGRFALGRLVAMGYQARMGMMAAGAYGLPQFRMRVFLWGALATEKLPQYPLPTHNVVMRGVVPTKFESNVVAFEEGQKVVLSKELFLYDAISDLPPVENDESRDEMPYGGEPETDFQRFIRLKKEGMLGSSESNSEVLNQVLYDHRPLNLNTDDYQRVCQIPVKKGANFRDLKGVRVGSDNKVEWDPEIPRVYLPSGKPLVPDYAMTFVSGTSSKPFGRLWWDETVPTVVTRAEPHNQVILHPTQNRVLTIRENARLQGFPDYYKLIGPIKERYIQVGNAVAVPVARAMGYCLAMACKGCVDTLPVTTLPSNFSRSDDLLSPSEST